MGIFGITPVEKEWRSMALPNAYTWLKTCIPAGQDDRVKYLLDNSTLAVEESVEIAKLIAASGTPEMLGSFSRKVSTKKMEEAGVNLDEFKLSLAKLVAQRQSDKMWDKLTHVYSIEYDSSLFFIQQGWEDKIPDTVYYKIKNPYYRPSDYNKIAQEICKGPSDKLFEYMLEKKGDVSSHTDWLVGCCEAGNAIRVIDLIDRGIPAAGVGDTYEPFLAAAEAGHKDILTILKDAGINPYHENCYSKWQFKVSSGKISSETNEYIKSLEWQTKAVQPPVAAEPEKEESADDALPMDIYKEVHEIAPGLTITNVFNFESRQQIIIVEKLNPPMMTTNVIPFTDIECDAALIRAEKKLIETKRRSDVNSGFSLVGVGK